MSTVLDYTGRIATKTLIGGDVVAVSRYLSWWYQWGGVTHSTVNSKVIQAAEYRSLVGGGVGVSLNWEYDARDWLGGAAAGTSHGQEAVRQAKMLGHPAGRAIYGSADFDMTSAQWTGSGYAYAVAFAAAVRAGGYAPGVYGPWDVLGWCQGIMAYFWQAGMSTAWSGGRNKQRWPGVHMRQTHSGTFAGQSVDYNEIIREDFGQWPAVDAAEEEIVDFNTKADIARLIGVGATYSEGYGSAQGGTYKDIDTWNLTAQLKPITVALAASAQRESAALAAIQALAQGGTSVDTAAVLARIDQAAAQESATVQALHDQIADLQTRLAAAGQALGS
jgi:hypothetical protein